LPTREERRRRSPLLAASLGLSLLCALVVCWELGRGEPHYNLDEGTHALTGLYFLDLLRDHPFSDPMGYTWDWYAHYPGLGVLLWPPLFHAALALGFAVLGPSLATGQIVVLLFFLVGCLAWFLLAREQLGIGWGLLTAALFATAPMVVVFSRMIMLEVPSLALAAAAFVLFHRFVEGGRARFLYAAAVLAGLALLTKPHAVFLAPAVLLAVVCLGRRDLFRSLHCILAATVVILLAAPYYALVFGMTGRVALDNAVSAPESAMGWASLARYTYYPAQLPLQLGWPLALLCPVALIAAPSGPWPGFPAAISR
jgi:4-amino-4-deoxy-L-arabinose transferase-like glycosyltransferase